MVPTDLARAVPPPAPVNPAPRRLREWTLHPPTDLVKRLERLAQIHQGPQTDPKAWAVQVLEQVADGMERSLAEQEAKKNLVQLVDAAGRPQVSVRPLVPGAGPYAG